MAEIRSGGGTDKARPVAWALFLIPAAAQFILHIVTNGRFGIFRDEYYYLACTARPAWGYVDHPSLSIWILSAWKGVFGDSLQSIRVLPALCGSGMIVLTGAAAAELGGGRWAQLLAGLGTGIGAAGLVMCGTWSMNCFDLLFWLGAYYLLIRIARTGDGRTWLWMGLVIGLGLLNKIGLLVFGAALVAGLLATRHRRHFKDIRLYAAGAIALAFVLPYLLWNAANGWPTLEFINNAQSGKIAAFTPWEFLSENILEANPLTLPLWAGGLIWLILSPRARRFRLLALTVAVTFAILVLQKSKPYYFASSFPVMMAAGGVAWEGWSGRRGLRWVRWVLLIVLVAGGVILAPIAVPLLSPKGTVDYARRIGVSPAPQEVGHTSALPQHFSDRLGWENLARTVSGVYKSLPEAERAACVAWGNNYGHAGALEYWSRSYELPPAYSLHNNYWFWGPPPDDTEVFIVVKGSREHLESLFEDVVEAAVARCPDAMESSMTIWLCRSPRKPVSEFWKVSRAFV